MRKAFLLLGLVGVAAVGALAVTAVARAKSPQAEAMRRQAMIAAFRTRQAAAKAAEIAGETIADARAQFARPRAPGARASSES